MTAQDLTAPAHSAEPPSAGGSRRIAVQHSLAPPDGRTKYVDQIVDGAAPDVRIRYFSWRAALLGRYDVFHVHWPELMIRGAEPVAPVRAQRRACTCWSSGSEPGASHWSCAPCTT